MVLGGSRLSRRDANGVIPCRPKGPAAGAVTSGPPPPTTWLGGEATSGGRGREGGDD